MKKNKLEIIFIVGVILTSFFLWDTFIIYPVKIFVVLLHEMSHGIASIITGGKLQSIHINEFLGGSSWSTGGNSLVIAFAGYLGSLIFGALLFISAYDSNKSKWICSILAVLLIIFAFYFIDGLLGILVSIAFALLLFISPRMFNKTFHLYLVKSLGLLSSLYVFIDIKNDLITLTLRESDTQVVASITSVPAIVWGFLWLFISLAVIIYLMKFGYSKNK